MARAKTNDLNMPLKTSFDLTSSRRLSKKLLKLMAIDGSRRDERAAKPADGDGKHDQGRQGERDGDHARQDQITDWIDVHGAQGVNLLIDRMEPISAAMAEPMRRRSEWP